MSIVKNFILYGIGSALAKALLWIAAPIALYTLPPAIMGLWSLCNSFIALGAIFMALGLRQVFFIEYYHKTSHERRGMINEIIILYISYAIPFCVLLWHFRTLINAYFFAGAASAAIIFGCLFACFLSFFTELLYQVLLYSQNTWLLMGIQLGGASITALSSLWVLLYTNTGVLGLVIAQILGLLIVCLCGCVLYFKKMVHTARPVLSAKKISRYIIQGIPFIPAVLSFWLLSSINRWLLATYATLDDVATYACAEMVNMLFQMFILYPLTGAYLPHIFAQFAHAKTKEEYYRVDAKNKRYMWLSMGVLVGIGTLGFYSTRSLLYILVPVAYQSIIPYLLLVGIGNIFLMGTYFASAFIQYSKKTLFLAGSLVLTALCTVLLSSTLVRPYGVGGCIIAVVCAYGFYFCITYWYNRRLHYSNGCVPRERTTARRPLQYPFK